MRKWAILAALLLLLSCSGGRDRYVQVSGFAQGGTYNVKLNVKGVKVPVDDIKDSIEAILTAVDTTLSGYNNSSLLSHFNDGEKIRPNAMFLEVYSMGYELWKRSGGLLDFAAGPLYDVWGFGFRYSEFPSAQEIESLLQNCGMRLLPAELPVRDGVLDPAELGNPSLNYNAIAQGYSCDQVARYLYSIGVKDMLIDIGEIWCDGLNPNGQPWAVGIDRPEDNPTEEKRPMETVWLSSGKPSGIVTSGNYRKFYIRDGRKYAHTINPRTGYPVQHNLLSATVVSSANAAESDAIATWCMVTGLHGAQVLILGDPNLEGYLIYTDDDGNMKEWASPGFALKN